jgi:hypothetical protein
MERKNIFGKGLSFLVVGVLAVLAFIRGPEQIWFLGGVFAAWGIWMLGSVLWRNWPRVKASLENRRLAADIRRAEYATGPQTPVAENPVSAVLLRHVNCRISGYLKSAYPDVTWEWCSETPERLIAEGGTGRIRLFGVSDFNYADVLFDKLARIGCDMLRIVPLADMKGNGVPEPPKQGDGQPPDPEVWYGIQGKKILESCVADLNSRGHGSLLIKESGDICFKQADTEVVRDRFKNLPGKGVWPGLVRVIEKQGLAAAIAGDCIKVSW